jgi:hypothetical protein
MDFPGFLDGQFNSIWRAISFSAVATNSIVSMKVSSALNVSGMLTNHLGGKSVHLI